MKTPVQDPLKLPVWIYLMTEILKNLSSFRSTFQTKKIVFDGLNPDRVMFNGNSFQTKKLYLLHNAYTWHYNVITNIKAAMAKKYMCNACDTLYDNTHKCDKACSLCTATPPCTKHQTKYIGSCNRWLISEKCFQNLLNLNVKGNLVCQWRQVWRKCSF